MSHHHHHHHNHPLPPPKLAGGKLKKNSYGVVVGTIDGPLSDADDNHVFIPIRISQGPFAGLYRAAFNTESNQGHAPVQYDVRDETIKNADVPDEEFTTDASVSYTDMGLKQSD